MAPTPAKSMRVKAERGTVVQPPPHPDSVRSLDGLLKVAEERRSRGPLLADLFSGCGGLSLGAEAAGFVPVLGVDHDPFALETWRSLFPGLAVDADLGDPDVVDELAEALRTIRVDAIVGGPPCQPFSRAGRSLLRHLVETGRRDAHDERRELWRSFLDIVRGALPSVVLMENVPELALGDDTLLLRTIVDELEQLGYGVATRIVSTSEHGVPQFRQRIIIVGLLGGAQFDWPDQSSWHPTLRMAIADLPEVEPGWTRAASSGGSDPYVQPDELNPLLAWLRRGVEPGDKGRVYDHVTRAVRDDDREIFDAMDSSTKYSDIDESLKRYRDDIFDDKYKRLDWDQPSRSITAHLAKDGYWYIHPSQPRTLTIREAARVQTFPDRVRFAGPPSASLRQIGNAVPPLAAFQLMDAARQSLGAAHRSPWSSRDIAGTLASWFTGSDNLSVPWLDPDMTTAWQVIQADLLLSRLDDSRVRVLWPLILQSPTPADTLRRADRLRKVLATAPKSVRLEDVIEAAKWFEAHHGDPFEHADAMAENPSVPSSTAHLAELVSCPDESPVIASTPVLRLVARFTGTRVDTVNKGTDGRVAIARMIGGSVFDRNADQPRFAHLALIELANSVCTPKQPRCHECPLAQWCHRAAVDPPAPRLF